MLPSDRANTGALAIGQPDRVAELDVDYDLRAIKGASINASISHVGRRAANLENSIMLPSRTLVDVSARYRFAAWSGAAALRLSVHNVTQSLGWDVDEGGGYTPFPGRSYSVMFTLDR